MNLIDHRILIPTSPEHIWRFVGDLRRNLEWHVNAKNIGVLTSNPKPGAGMRFRLSQQRGRDQVWEVTAWYDRFGYEYRIVEGSPFRQNKGLLRLQETPEGTVVQWTLSYSGGGLFGGAGKAQEQIIVESLQKLYKLITRSKDVDTFQAKSLMRDDPGVEARANYRPRHSTSIPTESGDGVRVPKSPYGPPTPSKPIPTVPIDNPFRPPAAIFQPPAPSKLGDTRPRPPLAEPFGNAASLEPDFLIDEPNTPFTDIPSEPVRVPPVKRVEPVIPAPVAPPPASKDEPIFAPPVFRPSAPPIEDAPPTYKPMIPPDFLTDEPPVVSAPPVFAPPPPLTPIAPPPVDVPPVFVPPTFETVTPILSEAVAQPPVSAPATPARDKLSDTSKLSVFEIFGLPKPSATQPMAPLNMEALSATGRIAALLSDPVPETVAEAVQPTVDSIAQTVAEVSVVTPELATTKPLSTARILGKRALLRRKLGNVRGRFTD